MQRSDTEQKSLGFTIVELLIVIVVIAILAAITVVAFNGINTRSKEVALKQDLRSAATQLQVEKTQTGVYPTSTSGLKKADATTFTYSQAGDTFCLAAQSTTLQGKVFHITSDGAVVDGACPLELAENGDLIQTITSANCPTSRLMAVDARDNSTYWVQQLADGKCWMLTNLSYAGGGVNTYSDVKTLANGTGGSVTYTAPQYYVRAGSSNPTVSPTTPSTSTDGGSTGTQYGYYYNWCGAMGAQTATSACANATTPAPSTTISVCPAGWRLPIQEPFSTGSIWEFEDLNDAVNGGSLTTDAGLRSAWLIQQNGRWQGSFVFVGSYGWYWSSTQNSAGFANRFQVAPGNVTWGDMQKDTGLAVRCLAANN